MAEPHLRTFDHAPRPERRWIYLGVAVGLMITFILLRFINWTGNSQLHTVMEVIATSLTAFVGVLALVRFYARKTNAFLLIGSGFLGAAFLECYHAIVTAPAFLQIFPSSPTSLIAWSWLASRLMLSVMLCVAWLGEQREHRLGAAGRLAEGRIYLGVFIFSIICFIFFAVVPLPSAYQQGIFIGRIQEFIPALFFCAALVGYYRNGNWQTSYFEHWLVLALLINTIDQFIFMSTSQKSFDMMFDAAHLLKKASYICVLTGLLISMFRLFRQAEQSSVQIEQANQRLKTENSERQQIEETLRVTIEKLRSQSDVLTLVSTPLLPISGDVVLMPLMGAIDAQRAQHIGEVLLQGVVQQHARVAIIDITAVPTLSNEQIHSLLRTMRGVKILGCQVILTGIGVEMVTTFVELGIHNLQKDIKTFSTLEQGIASAMASGDESEDAIMPYRN